MREIIIDSANSNIRLDKYLFRYLSKAPSSFVYKMLRKKNITLNKAKCTGHEVLKAGDCICLFLSDDTIDKFSQAEHKELCSDNTESINKEDIVYEDDNILIYHKRVGLLSQKAQSSDISANEIVLNYLKQNASCDFSIYKPSVINRIDRNTEGIIIVAKTYVAANVLSKAIKDRTLRKFYYCIVKGKADDIGPVSAKLIKNESNNTVKIYPENHPEGDLIKTAYRSVKYNGSYSLLEVELITGKSHQIRAHLAAMSHPILGDYKYGERKLNDSLKKQFGIDYQLLFAKRIVIPKLDGELEYLSGNTFEMKLPKIYDEIMAYGNLEFKRS